MNMKLIESKIDPDTKKAIYETDGKFYYCAGFVQDTISPKTLTFCISTQVGCPEKCKFCATGDHNLVRNLTAEEMAQEITDGVNYMQNSVANNNLDIVRLGFEGMGEFSHNAKNGFEAVKLVYPYLSSKFKQIMVRPTTVGNIKLVDKYKDFINQNQYIGAITITVSPDWSGDGYNSFIVKLLCISLSEFLFRASNYNKKTCIYKQIL